MFNRLVRPLLSCRVSISPLLHADGLHLLIHWLWRIVPLAGGLAMWQASQGGQNGNTLPWVLCGALVVLGEIRCWHAMRWRGAHALAKAAQLQLRSVIECLPEGFALYDQNDRLALCNQHYARLFSTTLRPEQLIGRSYRSMKQLALRHAAQVPEDGYDDTAWIEERIRRHRQGESFILRWGDQWYLAIDYQVPEVGIVSLRLNVTTLKRQELALREARRVAEASAHAKGAFLAMISHEIRTPFNGLLGWLDLLRATRLTQQQSAMLVSMHDAASSLLRLMDDIIDFSDLEAGNVTLAPVVTALRPLLAQVHQLFLPAAASRGLCCELVIAPEVAEAHVLDSRRLRQILVNFVQNALRHTERGGLRLTVEVESEGGGKQLLRFSCIDSGCGLSNVQQSTLFQPFSRDVGRGNRQQTGAGLGLAICQRLAGLMDGKIGLSNQPQGGTRAWLTVRLDCAISPSAQPGTPADAVSPLPFAGMAPVLLVEDHPCNRQLMAMQLERLGVAFQVAEHGEQGLALWRAQPFSLVLTDCHMPVMDGYQLARAIRQEEAERGLPPVPVIACTANQAADVASLARDAGMSHVLTKPVDMAVLATTLRLWLDMPDISARAARTKPGPMFDWSVLFGLCQGSRSKAWQLVAQFAAIGAADRQALRQAVDAGDSEQAVWYAHRIKGSARTLGANGLADAAQNLERAARAASPLTDAWQTLERGFADMESWMARQPGLARRARRAAGCVQR